MHSSYPSHLLRTKSYAQNNPLGIGGAVHDEAAKRMQVELRQQRLELKAAAAWSHARGNMGANVTRLLRASNAIRSTCASNGRISRIAALCAQHVQSSSGVPSSRS